MASSQDGERAERLTNTLFDAKIEDAVISSAHRCCRARVVRYCVAPEQRHRDLQERETGNEDSIYDEILHIN